MRSRPSAAVRRARPVVAAVALVSVALAASGVAMMIVKTPRRVATDSANRGFFMQPGRLPRLGSLHENLALLLVLAVSIGGAWLMVRVKQDWLSGFAWALLTAIVAGLTGLLVQYEAILIGDRYEADLRGSGFVFDPDFAGALYGGRLIGANVYRLLLVFHVLAALACVAATWIGVRALDHHDDDIWEDGRRRRNIWRGSTTETAV